MMNLERFSNFPFLSLQTAKRRVSYLFNLYTVASHLYKVTSVYNVYLNEAIDMLSGC